MEIREFGPDDVAEVHAFLAVSNTVGAADAPWMPPDTERSLDGAMRHGWDGEPARRFLAVQSGEVVGVAYYSTSTRDNTHVAWLWVGVDPGHRRRGVGSAILAELLERARSEGRTSVGLQGLDTEHARAFATHHGFEQKYQEVVRRQVMERVDWALVERLHAEALDRARDYELVRRTGPTPDDELAPLADMSAAINDAPTDDLDIEDEVYTPERVRAYENAQLGREQDLHRVLARHRTTGELAGHTVVVVEHERPWLGEQHDTAVVDKHRGHRLGLALKTEMLLWLREERPQLRSFDTWNAESNDHMVSVNEQLGYEVLGREVQFQRAL